MCENRARGAPAPPGLGGPEDNPEKEADDQKDTGVIAQSDVCVTQPSSPSLPPTNVSAPSLTKECENTSVTEETSFASCLTEETSTLSECCVLPSQNVTPASEASRAPGREHQADPLSNSVSDSVALNITQNGVKKDSEYESAEELDSPAGASAVVEEPPSTSANVVTNQTQSSEQELGLPVPLEVSNSPPKEGFVVPADKEEDIKPKAKVVTPKKSPAKKGFSVIKKGSKKPADEVDSSKKETSQATPTPTVEAENQEELPAVPSKGYNLDFLDDPNFDPFKTRSGFESKSLPAAQNLDAPSNKPEDAKTPVPLLEKEAVKATEVKEKSPDQQPKRLDADGSDSNSINASSEKQNKEVLAEKAESKSEIDVEDQPAEEEPKLSEVSSLSVKENTSVPVTEEKPQSLEKVKPQTSEEKTLDVKSQVLEEKTQVAKEKENLQVATEEVQVENKAKIAEVKPQVAVVKPQVVEVKPLVVEADPPVDKGTLPPKEEHLPSADTTCDRLDSASKTEETTVVGVSEEVEEEVGKTSVKQETKTESEFVVFEEANLPKVPSIGRIGQLDSLEFAQLLGNEASRLAEEFMNCSCDSGLPDSDDSNSVKCTSSASDMDPSKAAHYSGAHLDDSVNPFMKSSRLPRSPPLGKRGAVCGAESADSSEMMDPFKPRRALRREEVLGEDRQDTLSVDEDSGIVMPTRSDLEVEVNHSEAGPEIATGLTSSDLRCASQFFKEASDLERQFRRNLSTPMGSQSKLSGDEVTPIKEKPEHPSVTPESPQNKPVPSTSTPIPPREERSAPEGTSSPTPRPSDTSEHKPSSSRPLSVPPDGYVTTAEVEELLKRQSLQFEEKLLRAELAAGEKERKLIQAMKEEQKEKGNLGGSLTELTQSRDALLKMVGQYKGMLAQLVGEKEKEKQNAEERIKTLESERNQALDDLANVENAFSDVHRKYERTKQVVDTLRRNEETLRGAITDYESKLQKQEQKFIEFQKHAEEKIQLANEEFETMRKANEQEMTKMAALLKKAEMKIVSLQDAFDRKTRENQELTQLCDDLINKVGGTN
ncbi:putative transforming acidic coiled-coil-containing protein 1-like isoform X1 [Penaeus vannamei]|uniref:Putative transforming acidic coiled-coil-containing protein 1-like isoform X1 n=1 Tax=Penaeus vannamei TaxID=6689 RepID=A0A423TY50_PENVA|nr:putative transforming acidic coiled-coil-containing protein 1-like isoform X1 [Penaeus vannamei]